MFTSAIANSSVGDQFAPPSTAPKWFVSIEADETNDAVTQARENVTAPPAHQLSGSEMLQVFTDANIVPLHGLRERTIARFRRLRRLRANHDNEGASAADPSSVDRAIAFVGSMSANLPYYATLDDDGSAVIEFEDANLGVVADLTFRSDGTIDCYCAQAGRPSRFCEGMLHAASVRLFLAESVGVQL